MDGKSMEEPNMERLPRQRIETTVVIENSTVSMKTLSIGCSMIEIVGKKVQ
jgi:hypothetical protein